MHFQPDIANYDAVSFTISVTTMFPFLPREIPKPLFNKRFNELVMNILSSEEEYISNYIVSRLVR